MEKFTHMADYKPSTVREMPTLALDAGDSEMRYGMTRKDLALEMIRKKRAQPVYDREDDVTYASISELARTLGVSPQQMRKKVRSQYGRMRYDIDATTQDREDLMACESVDEYVLHYMRKYYDDIFRAHLHVVSMVGILQTNVLRRIGDRPQVLNVREDGIYDVFPYDHQGEEKETFVCTLEEVGA